MTEKIPVNLKNVDVEKLANLIADNELYTDINPENGMRLEYAGKTIRTYKSDFKLGEDVNQDEYNFLKNIGFNIKDYENENNDDTARVITNLKDFIDPEIAQEFLDKTDKHKFAKRLLCAGALLASGAIAPAGIITAGLVVSGFGTGIFSLMEKILDDNKIGHDVLHDSVLKIMKEEILNEKKELAVNNISKIRESIAPENTNSPKNTI